TSTSATTWTISDYARRSHSTPRCNVPNGRPTEPGRSRCTPARHAVTTRWWSPTATTGIPGFPNTPDDSTAPHSTATITAVPSPLSTCVANVSSWSVWATPDSTLPLNSPTGRSPNTCGSPPGVVCGSSPSTGEVFPRTR